MPPAATDHPPKRRLSFATTHLHWLLLGVAVLLVLTQFIPQVYRAAMTADNIQLGIFFHDIVEQGHHVRDWTWGGHSDLFTDVALVFLVDSIVRNGLLALYIASGIVMLACITALLALYRSNGGRNIETFAAALLLLFVLLLVNFNLRPGAGFRNFLVIPMHAGIMIYALACLALFQRAVFKGGKTSLCLLAIFSFLASNSDPLFLVIFPVPLAAAAIVTSFLYPGRLRGMLPPAAIALLFCALGHLLTHALFPATVDAAPYTGFDPRSARFSWEYLCYACAPSVGGLLCVFLALDLAFVAFVAILLVITFRRPAAKRMPPALFLLLFFCACLIVSNIGATILTGNFYTSSGIRYFRLALLLPPVFLIAWLNHIIPWSRLSSGAAVAALSLATSCVAFFLCPPPDSYYRTQQELIPFLRPIMEREHIEAGLSDYWFANLVTFFSHDSVTIRSIRSTGLYFSWVANIRWFKGDDSAPPPKFRLIYMDRLDPDLIRMTYGAPSRILRAPTGQDVWIYPEDKSITYDPIFDRLSNDPPHEYRAPAAMLPSQTGKRDGDSLIARAGVDHEGAITYGPYIHPPGGRYRVIITYAWLAAPAPGKSAVYDTALWKPDMKSFAPLDQADIPFIDTTTRQIEREIQIPAGNRGAIEVHTWYHASGDLRIDSLRVIFLGPL